MPAAKLANLSVGVSADTAELTGGFKKAESAAVRFGAAVTARGTSIGTRLAANVTGPLAAAFAAFNLASFAKSTIDALDAFNDLSDATGVSIENISALDAIARRTGGSFATVETALLKMSKAMREGSDSEAGSAIRGLGLDFENLKKLDAAEQFVEISKALAQFEDGAEKSAYTSALFGKSLAEMAPFLKDVAARGELVATSTSKMSDEAEIFNKHLGSMTAAFTDNARSIIGNMLPAMNSMMERFSQVETTVLLREIKATEEELKKLHATAATVDLNFFDATGIVGLSGAWAGVGEDAKSVAKQFNAAQERLKSLREEYRKLTTPPPQKAVKSLSTQQEEDAAKAKAIKDAADARKKASDDEAAEVKRRAQDVDQYIRSLEMQAEATEKLTEVEKAYRAIARGDLKPKDASDAGRIVDAAAKADQYKQLADNAERAAYTIDLVRQANEKFAEEGAAVVESVATPMERYTQQMAQLRALYWGDKLGPKRDETFQRASGTYEKELQEAQGAFDQLTEFSKQASANIQDALGDALENGFNGTLKDMAQSWLEMLRKMAAQALAARLNNAMFGNGTSDKGWLGSLLETGARAWFGAPATPAATPGASADAYTNLYNIPKLATGTDFVPYDGFVASLHRGEKVVPAKYAAKEGAGGTNVTIQNHGADVQTRKNDRGDLEVVIRNMVRNEMAGDLASGGPISRAQQRTFGLTRALDRR